MTKQKKERRRRLRFRHWIRHNGQRSRSQSGTMAKGPGAQSGTMLKVQDQSGNAKGPEKKKAK
ncbi:hypothetical protein HYD74_03790 [Mycoplasmopsis bovis]|nr:hypothetical protein HYD74_03790 [Mycoplasmopsis bovis]